MTDFFEILQTLPDPKVVILHKTGKPLLRLSVKGIEYLDWQIFNRDDILLWSEIEAVHIVTTRVTECFHLTPRLANFETKKKQLPSHQTVHIKDWFQGVPVLVELIGSIQIQDTDIIINQYDLESHDKNVNIISTFEWFTSLECLVISGEAAGMHIYAEKYNQVTPG